MKTPRSAFLSALRARISPDERAWLEAGDHPGLSRYNRQTLLRMLGHDAVKPGLVDGERAASLEAALRSYLDRYMADQPQGHRWIVLSCLYLVFVAEEPMHPQPIVHWTRVDGGYVCPTREDGEGSLCRWCVCRGAAEEPPAR